MRRAQIQQGVSPRTSLETQPLGCGGEAALEAAVSLASTSCREVRPGLAGSNSDNGSETNLAVASAGSISISGTGREAVEPGATVIGSTIGVPSAVLADALGAWTGVMARPGKNHSSWSASDLRII